MINTVPRVRTMSEPWSFNHLHAHYVNGKIEYEELRRLVHSAVRLQCKRERGTEIDHILIKGWINQTSVSDLNSNFDLILYCICSGTLTN